MLKAASGGLIVVLVSYRQEHPKWYVQINYAFQLHILKIITNYYLFVSLHYQ